jgi:DNA-binding transcriptional LysR family regulator
MLQLDIIQYQGVVIMTLQQIQYVIEIANQGKINKAAEELYIAQPYLSNSLKNLEDELGIIIFKRSHRGVELTIEGREFLFYAKQLIEQEKKISEIYKKNKNLDKVLFFSLSTQHYPFIIKAFYSFFSKYNTSRYEVHLRELNMYNVISDIYSKKSGIGIIFISNLNKKFIEKYLSSKNIEFNELIKIKPKVFFHKNHPMAAKNKVSLEEMAKYPFASFESDVSVSDNFSEEILMHDFNPNQNHIYVVDRGTMINTLTHTDAFSIGTGILSPGYAGADLISRPISNFDTNMQLGWICLRGVQLNDLEQEFLNTVKSTLLNS